MRLSRPGACRYRKSARVKEPVITARINSDTAQWLMDIGVLHYTDSGWVVQRDIWRSPTDEEIAEEANRASPDLHGGIA